MLIVATYIEKSAIHGVGVFAAEKLSAGQKISRFEPAFDRLVPRAAYEAAPYYLRNFLDRYSFPHPDDPDLLVYEVDNCRLINHSDAPNTDFTNFAEGVALRDIDIGEELTCNYGQFFGDYELMDHEIELTKAR